MSEFSVVDTNVLVYSLTLESPHHPASKALRDRALDAEANLAVTPQILAEFLAVTTRTSGKGRVESPFSPEEAAHEVEELLNLPGLFVLPVPDDLPARTLALLRQYPARGRDIFDRQLAATMLAWDVTTIFTFNTRHFQMIAELEVIEPTLEGQAG